MFFCNRIKSLRSIWKDVYKRQYLWYPIIFDVKNSVYSILEQKFIVIPCMNNKVLLLNTSNTDNIVFLDEACDPPSFANWDSNVSQGEIPPVVYEALEDYYVYGDDMPRELISENCLLYTSRCV